MLLTLKRLLDVFEALRTLALWLVKMEKEANAKAAVEKAQASHDQTPVEREIDHASLGHTASDLPSVRIEPIKDRSKH